MDSPDGTNKAEAVVSMRGIVKRFPGVLANDHVDFDLRKGRSMRCWVRTAPEKAR